MNLPKKLYFKIYDALVKKELTKQNGSHCFFGHTHIPRNGQFFTTLGSYRDNEIYENKDWIIISDVHLGLFEYSKDELEELKNILRKDKLIILLGDFFDLHYAHPQELQAEYGEIISIIQERQKNSELVYIQGNHDWYVESKLGIIAKEAHQENDVVFFHGHLCDPFRKIFPFNIYTYVRLRLGYKLHFLKTALLFLYAKKA